MRGITSKLRNAAMPNAWVDPSTFTQAADYIEELEEKVNELQGIVVAELLALAASAEPKRPRGRPKKTIDE
jgi:hypothetical protein